MKKLEKMDGKLFESLKPNEMSNLGALVGGMRFQTTADKSEGGCQDVLYADQTGPDSAPKADWTKINSDWNVDRLEGYKDPKNEAVTATVEVQY